MTDEHNRRIARNSAFMYGRILITLGISLYTSRIVLERLGIDNYGVYNVVGSIVTIFTFINGSMAGATQRFLNYEMGRGESERLRHTFASSLLIHIGIAILLFIAGETIGLWWVNNRLVIDPVRLEAARTTFQLSLAATACTIIEVPYMASIIAHERMDAFALIALLSAFLRLGVALALAWFGSFDTLIVYAWLMFGVSVVLLACYALYARSHFAECRARRRVPGSIIRSLLGFSLSDIFGNLCYTLRLQSVAVILNRFGGEVLNAAVGLNITVSTSITQFGTTIISTFRPQIIQQYAAGDYKYMQSLMINCAKFSLLMVCLIAIPAIITMNFLLHIWLVEVPAYTAIFCRLTIIAGTIELIVFSLNAGVHATGRIKAMSIITGSIYLLEIPGMWLLLQLTTTPWIVYALHICIMVLMICVVGSILKHLMPQFSLRSFAVKGILVPLSVIIPTAVGGYAVAQLVGDGWLGFIAIGFTTTLLLAGLTWCLAIDHETRGIVLDKLHLSRNKRQPS